MAANQLSVGWDAGSIYFVSEGVTYLCGSGMGGLGCLGTTTCDPLANPSEDGGRSRARSRARARNRLVSFFLSIVGCLRPDWGMATAGPLLKLANVTKRYDSPDRAAPLTILNGVSLEVLAGESVAIVG